MGSVEALPRVLYAAVLQFSEAESSQFISIWQVDLGVIISLGYRVIFSW